MPTYKLTTKLDQAPRGTWTAVKDALNKHLDGWAWEKPAFTFDCSPETIPQIQERLTPLQPWLDGLVEVKTPNR